jgi:predicted dehydrogenase
MKIRVGIIGTGFAAGAHVDALSRLPNVEIVAIAGRTLERAQEAADRFAIPRAYAGYEALLADPEVDAVHNCTPNSLHAEVTAAALDARRHLLSEKPLAIDSQESAALTARAAAAHADGVLSAVCFNYRFYPLVRELKETLAAGEHGQVHFVHGGYLQDWLLYDTDWSWRVDPELNGPSRAVADIGSHSMDLLQYVIGARIGEVFADLGTLHPLRRRAEGGVTFAAGSQNGELFEVDTEDFGTVALRFDNGARGALVLSQVSAGHKNRLHFTIDAGRASFTWDQEEPNRLWIGHRDEPNQELVRDAGLLSRKAAELTRFPGGHQEGWPDALLGLFRDFYAAIEARRAGRWHAPSYATFADGHQIVQLVEAVIASHTSGTWVRLDRLHEVPVAPAQEAIAQ